MLKASMSRQKWREGVSGPSLPAPLNRQHWVCTGYEDGLSHSGRGEVEEEEEKEEEKKEKEKGGKGG